MASRVLHITEADLVRDVQGMLLRAQTGTEIIIERNAQPIAILRAVIPEPRKISECIAMLPEDSSATIDPDFARDVDAAINAHRDPFEPSAWE